jgi:hypothetical protein
MPISIFVIREFGASCLVARYSVHVYAASAMVFGRRETKAAAIMNAIAIVKVADATNEFTVWAEVSVSTVHPFARLNTHLIGAEHSKSHFKAARPTAPLPIVRLHFRAASLAILR